MVPIFRVAGGDAAAAWYFNAKSRFSHAEQDCLRQATSELNQLIAARVESRGVATFLPVDGLFAGHEVSGNVGEWINGASLHAPLTRGQFLGTNHQGYTRTHSDMSLATPRL
jgi:hypothetical protein